MIDFVRLKYTDKGLIEPFICNKDNFKELFAVVEYHSGEVNYPVTTMISNMEVRINDKSVYVKNSIHKLKNKLKGNLSHNYDDFKYSEICETIKYLEDKLIDLDNSKLTQLEFGLNINLDVPAEYVVRKNIVLHQLDLHNHYEQFGGTGAYKQFNHYNYYFKIYDKAMQYGLDENIIRFELKYKSSKEFNPFGAIKLRDLKSKQVLKNLFKDLLRRFDELTIVDEITVDYKISKKDKSKLQSFLSYNYWKNLSERKNRNRKTKAKEDFTKLLIKNNLLKTKELIRAKLEAKFEELIKN